MISATNFFTPRTEFNKKTELDKKGVAVAIPDKIVLIVEDDMEMNNLLKIMIGQVCDCPVEQIYNGTDALQRISASHKEIRLIILDLSLPGVSSKDVLDVILSRNIPVAIVTADPIAAQRLVGRVVGAVFTKPWKRMEFLAKLTSLLLADTE